MKNELSLFPGVALLLLVVSLVSWQIADNDSKSLTELNNAGSAAQTESIANKPARAQRVPSTSGLQINEILASNRRGSVDDQGETSDWVEIHNSSLVPVRVDSFYLTDDKADLTKWAFPKTTIQPGGYHVVRMSGIGQTELTPEALINSALTIPMETTLIEPGAQWKYLTAEPVGKPVPERPTKFHETKMPGNWADVDFDASNFKIGTAGFGYGDEDDQTELPFGTTCILLRHEFTLDQPLLSDSLVLQMDYDDGFVAFLNGQRVCASNANREKLTFNSVASGSHESAGAERFDLSKHAGLLRVGKNVLAIVGLNTHSSSSDMSVNPSLGTMPTISHANFTLPKKGGELFLVGPGGTMEDRVEYKKQLADQSYGRFTSDESKWGYFVSPSPGEPNRGTPLAEPIKSNVTFDPAPGVHLARLDVQIKSKSSAKVELRFTVDGSEPGPTSQLVEEPLRLERTSAIRVATFVGDARLGPVVSATYVIAEKPELPIMSVTMKPKDFEDVHLQRSGISRAGERPAFIEMIDRSGKRQVATGVGFRLHGGAGRRGGIEKKKSYRLYFRKLYGDGRMNFPVIPEANIDEFDKLVLRANSNDGGGHGAYIRDQVIRDLHRDMGGLASAGDWCILMINAVNHGVYNLSERMDEEFFASHLGPGQFDVIKTGETVLSGSRDQWQDLRGFIARNDFAKQANYESLSQRVDIENFTAYVIVNLWAQNFDWPHNNWYAARRVPDGKWIFSCWDAEWGLAGMPSGYKADPYAFMDSGGAYGNGLLRSLFFALLSNSDYRQYYQQEVRRHLAGGLSAENVKRQVQRHRDAIQFDIENEFERKGYGKERWRRPIRAVEEFAQNRNDFFQKYTDEYFGKQENLFAETDRVAIMELGDRRHVVYRTRDRKLRELVSNGDGSVWKEFGVSELAKSPLAVGSPSAFVCDDARHVIYRGEDDHLHLLSKSIRGEDDSDSWQHKDLTSLLKLPVADCDPAVAVTNNVPHIVFRDRQPSRIHEIWFKNKWYHHPLPAAPRPQGGVRISASPRGLFVTYRTVFGAVCEQAVHRHQMKDDGRAWDSLLLNSMPSEGTPIGFHVRDKRHLVFQAAKKWPNRQPFVFFGRSAAPEYQGSHQSLAHAWAESHFFRNVQPVGEPESRMVGDPCLIANPKSLQFLVAYRDDNGSIQEARFEAGQGDGSKNSNWQISDLSTSADAPSASGEPEGHFSVRSGERYYVYRGVDGHFHELRFDGKWRHSHLTKASGVLVPGK